SYVRENFRDFVGLSAGKLRIGGTKWEVGVFGLEGFADARHNFESAGGYIGHPFVVDGQQHAFLFKARTVRGVLYDYYGGGIRQGFDPENGKFFDLIYRNRTEEMSAEYLYGIGKNNRIEIGPAFEHRINQDYYINSSDQYTLQKTPALGVSKRAQDFYLNEQFLTQGVSLNVNTRNGYYFPMKNFQRYLFTEDQFEGLRTRTKVLHANPIFGLSDHYTLVDTYAVYQHNLFSDALRLETALARTATFWENRYATPRDDVWKVDVRFFNFHRWGTLAARTFTAVGNNMSANARREIAAQFTRGFYYGSFTPSSGFLASAEYRSPGVRLPYVLVAAVAFIDYVGVGDATRHFDWYPIVGFGLRTMLYEIDNNVFRLDFGFNLNDSNLNLLKAIQFGMNHAF
ncbi:MAG TPA: hypothetical protein PLY93_10835, partial [Turneriella sp.]|nr:hypothetical protein [Turneriella sp.]